MYMPATELSKRLTKIREERGYKRTELAETLGIPYRTITNYETNIITDAHGFNDWLLWRGLQAAENDT